MLSVRTSKLAKNTIFLYCRTFIQLIIALYTSRIVLANLGITDFGIYNVIAGTVSMFAFVNASLAVAVQRFLAYELGNNDFEKLKIIFSTSKRIHNILSLCLFIIAELAGIWFLYYKMNIPADRINAGFVVLQASIFVLALNVITVPYNASIIAHEAFTMFAYIGILDVILKLLLAIAVVFFITDSLVVYAIGMFGITLLITVIYKQYCFFKYEECRQKGKFDRNTFNEMFSFAGWNFMGAFSQICKNQGVNIILNIFCGVAVNAAQGITSQVNAAVTQFASNFTTALNPQIIKAYSANEKTYFTKLVHTGSKISFMLITIIAIPIMLEVNYILNLWLKEAPPYTGSFIILILVNSIIISWTGTVSIAIRATGQIKIYSLILSLFNIIVLPVSYLCLKFGQAPTTVYIIYIFIQLLASLIVLYLSKRLLHLSYWYFIKQVIMPTSIVVIFSIMILIKIQSFYDESFLRLLSISFISTIILSLQYYFFVFSRDERRLIKSIISHTKNRFLNHS